VTCINKTWKSIYFSLGEHFLDIQEVKKIDTLLKRFPLEYITVGDAGEINNCQVGRLVEDKPNQLPKRLNVELSNGIIMESNILNLKFIISSSEYKNSSLNDILLKNIAYNSNGKYYKIDNMDSLIQFYDKESYFKLSFLFL